MRAKRGQEILGMSFGTIFAIILIIVSVAVGFYAIKTFLGWNSCRQQVTFSDHLQQEITNAWNSDTLYKDSFPKTPLSLPSGVEYVCFGNLDMSLSTSNPDNAKRLELKSNLPDRLTGYNLFYYPPKKSCLDSAYFKLEHFSSAKTFICKKVVDGKTNLILEFDRDKGPLVTIN